MSRCQANIWVETYGCNSYHDDIGKRRDCVSMSALTLADQRVHTEDHDEVLDT